MGENLTLSEVKRRTAQMEEFWLRCSWSIWSSAHRWSWC